jgi:hypothetical protein
MTGKPAVLKPQAANTDFAKAGTFYAPEMAEEFSRVTKRQIPPGQIVDDFYGIWNKRTGHGLTF